MLAALVWLFGRLLVALVCLWGLGVCWLVWTEDKPRRELRRRIDRAQLLVHGGGVRRAR
jgi:hypothetical protein